jgi:hypothetical protein
MKQKNRIDQFRQRIEKLIGPSETKQLIEAVQQVSSKSVTRSMGPGDLFDRKTAGQQWKKGVEERCQAGRNDRVWICLFQIFPNPVTF